MIVVDSSALIAILRGEPESLTFAAAIIQAEHRVISAATWFEASMVWIGRSDDIGQSEIFDELLTKLGLEVHPLTPDHARIARDAFRRYGKGRGTPTRSSTSATALPTLSPKRSTRRCC